MFKVTSRWQHQDSIKIEWNLGKRCNYDCQYCPAAIHDLTSPHTDIDTIKKCIDKIASLGKIRLSFTGGEPTVHPQFSEILRYAKYKGIHWINVTTNGTRKADWYVLQPVDHYVFSLHFEPDWPRVLRTIIDVSRTVKFPVMVNVMAHHEKMVAVRSAVDKLKSHEVPYAVRRIRWTEGDHDLFDDMRYNGNDLEWIKEQTATVKANCVIDDDGDKMLHANDIIKLHLNKYKGWSCNAGLESLMINWDGEVHRATCRVGGSLGNIYEGSFEQPTSPVICDRNFCTCAADIPLTKVKNED
jgi:MoaA/NifB/PqqE/SkfB family radical SAM enzyme